MPVGFWLVEFGVDEPKKYHTQPEGTPEDKSLKSIQSPIQRVLSVELKLATGAAPQEITKTVIVSVF